REARRDRRDGDPGVLERLRRRRNEGVVQAHGPDLDAELARAEGVEDVPADRALRLGTESEHVGRGVVALQGCEVEAGDGTEQPGGLPFLLDRAARGDRRGAALHGALVHAQGADQIHIEDGARVAPRSRVHPEGPLGRGGRDGRLRIRTDLVIPLRFHPTESNRSPSPFPVSRICLGFAPRLCITSATSREGFGGDPREKARTVQGMEVAPPAVVPLNPWDQWLSSALASSHPAPGCFQGTPSWRFLCSWPPPPAALAPPFPAWPRGGRLPRNQRRRWRATGSPRRS